MPSLDAGYYLTLLREGFERGYDARSKGENKEAALQTFLVKKIKEREEAEREHDDH